MKILSIAWDKFSSQNIYQVYLEFLEETEDIVKKLPLKDYDFGWRLGDEKKCVGTYINDLYEPCNNLITGTNYLYDKCEKCEEKLGFKNAFFNMREPNENIKPYIYSLHKVYLAIFAPNRIKVGTTAQKRKFARLFEQDALLSCYIATTENAYQARRIELEISRYYQIKESISSNSKLKFLFSNPAITENVNILRSLSDKIMYKFSDVFSGIASHIEINDLNNHASIYYPMDGLIKIPEKEELVLSGKFKGLRGRYLILENDGKDFYIDTRKIIGRRIEDFISGYNYKKQDQLNFFSN